MVMMRKETVYLIAYSGLEWVKGAGSLCEVLAYWLDTGKRISNSQHFKIGRVDSRSGREMYDIVIKFHFVETVEIHKTVIPRLTSDPDNEFSG